jgi:hypothetical protein
VLIVRPEPWVTVAVGKGIYFSYAARGLCHISGFYLVLLSSQREPGYAIPMP